MAHSSKSCSFTISILSFTIFKNNDLGAKSLKELIKSDIGIIAPLSGDYVMARVYSSYIQRTKGKTFPVRAAALSKTLSECVLPLDSNGNVPFAEKPELAIYIDSTETGSTAKMLFSHLQRAYPQKTIHVPRTERLEFTPSKKI